MVVEQTINTLFLFIFLVTLQYSPCLATSIALSPSTSQLDRAHCDASSPPPSPLFQKYLSFAINELKAATRSNLHFKYYTYVDDYTPIVHASYLCQVDITLEKCFDCVSRATKAAQSSCSDLSTEAVVYEEECSFRYSDKSFYGQFDSSSPYVDPLYEPFDSNKVSVERFGKALNQTIDTIVAALRTNSKYGPKFKTDVAKVDGTTTKIYALGECTWDLYQEDCRLCVHECASMLPAGRVGGRVMLPSCNFRYETTQFYDEASVIPSPSQPPPSHRAGRRLSPPPPRPPGRGRKANSKAAATSTGGGVAGLLIGGVLTWAYQNQKKKTMQDSQVKTNPPSQSSTTQDDMVTAAAKLVRQVQEFEARAARDESRMTDQALPAETQATVMQESRRMDTAFGMFDTLLAVSPPPLGYIVQPIVQPVQPSPVPLIPQPPPPPPPPLVCSVQQPVQNFPNPPSQPQFQPRHSNPVHANPPTQQPPGLPTGYPSYVAPMAIGQQVRRSHPPLTLQSPYHAPLVQPFRPPNP